MKVWYDGHLIDMYIGQVVTVFRRGSSRTVFGELATLTKATTRHLIFTADSGAIIKTQLDNIHATIGRAKESGYCVSPKSVDNFPYMIHEAVRYWDCKTCTFVNK